MNSPTEKQIKEVEQFTKMLKIDFPQNSDEYNEEAFQAFIETYRHQYIEAVKKDMDAAWLFDLRQQELKERYS